MKAKNYETKSAHIAPARQTDAQIESERKKKRKKRERKITLINQSEK